MQHAKTKGSNKRRIVGIIISFALMAAILLTGTFAFVLPMQHRSNEFEGGGIRYDATLNENFTPVTNWNVRDPEVTKQINVTNTGNNDTDWGSVFVRINLREFMEIYDTTYYYWAADGTTMVPHADMFPGNAATPRAALFMTASNRLAGNASRVFVVAPSTYTPNANPDLPGTWADLSETAARAAIFANYGDLFPGLDATLAGRTLVLTQDYVSGVRGWFVISEQGDLHGQYGRYMVAQVGRDTTNPTIVGTPTTPRATNVDYGSHEENGECNYDIHTWGGINNATLPRVTGTFGAPVDNYRAWIEWTLGSRVILYTEWDNFPTDAWIIDNRPGETEGWVYWGRELMVGETTPNFLEGVRLLNQPDGDFYYVIHTHMESVSYASLNTWPINFRPIGLPSRTYIVNPAGNQLPLEGDPILFDINYVNGQPTVNLGNGFVLQAGASGRVGERDSVVTFGSYLQTYTGDREEIIRGSGQPNADFENEALTWLVLDIDAEDGTAKLITEYVVDNVLLNLATADGNEWATSNARAWLNSLPGGVDRGTVANNNQTPDGFLNTAFTAAQRNLIVPTYTTAADDGATIVFVAPGDWNMAFTPAPPAIVNGDMVFALSNTEVWRYFGVSSIAAGNVGDNPLSNYTNGHTPGSDYFVAKGGHVRVAPGEVFDGMGAWRTRSAATGTTFGSYVAAPGSISINHLVTRNMIGMRPAITVDLGAPTTAD